VDSGLRDESVGLIDLFHSAEIDFDVRKWNPRVGRRGKYEEVITSVIPLYLVVLIKIVFLVEVVRVSPFPHIISFCVSKNPVLI